MIKKIETITVDEIKRFDAAVDVVVAILEERKVECWGSNDFLNAFRAEAAIEGLIGAIDAVTYGGD